MEKMKNFPVEVDGKEYWISRSMAVVAMAVKKVENWLYVLVERRGEGAADNKGKLCMPCGYLDYDETLKGACARELKEETGLDVDPARFRMLGINSDPSENRQNVTARYYCLVGTNENFRKELAVGGEKDEVDYVFWLNAARIENGRLFVNNVIIDAEQWAFNHENRVKQDILTVFENEYMRNDIKL